jgi:hypothetical protein
LKRDGDEDELVGKMVDIDDVWRKRRRRRK